MSSYLWKAYYEDNVDEFRRLLEAAGPSARATGLRGSIGHTFAAGSPGGLGTSPTMLSKSRKISGQVVIAGSALTRSDINWRDANGMTILHHVASSTSESALGFAVALVEHPQIDLYPQDLESGWTALHRAFYFGNVAIARLILEREADDVLGRITGIATHTIGLVKTKDREGLGPLDLYAATIKDRTLRPDQTGRTRADSDASDVAVPDNHHDELGHRSKISYSHIKGDEVFTFGSNRNVTLGFGDEDNRQFPERINLRRPEQLLRRFYREHLSESANKIASHDATYESNSSQALSTAITDIPWVIKSKPLTIQDVHMSKLHSAVLTDDPESNLYVCGHGQGGRLGVGDERTRYHFTCVDGGALAGKKIASVALGQNHTLAITDEGEIFSWGNNGFGQLGYNLPRTTATDEDPISVTPRQIFGPLKREAIIGVAASRVHSVAFTGSSLFTFGKNEGQLGIVDSDARSLEVQVTPRKVAASLFTSAIASVTAIDRATVCLLENKDVWVFASYGYVKVAFPLEGFSNYFLKQSFRVTSYDHAPNRIIKVTSGGDTICALSSRGEIFTLSVVQRLENASSSTTNPAKIRNAVSAPQCIWSLKKDSMAARDVSIDADGSIILTTEEGSVWQRTKRATIKGATAAATTEYKPKDYKFSRIPGLTRVLAVRSSAYGAYAAVRRDCDVTRTQVIVEDPNLWKDIAALCALNNFATAVGGEEDIDRPRFWQAAPKHDAVQALKRAIAESKDLEADLQDICDRTLPDHSAKYDAVLTTTTSKLRIPVHRFLLTGRSSVLRRGFRDLCAASTFTVPDLAVSELDDDGRVVVKFQGLDGLTIVDLAMYIYTDTLVDFWHIRNAKHLALRYRQVRTELMKVALKLDLVKLEPAVRQMVEPVKCLDLDFEIACKDPAFYFDGDIIVQLEDDEVRVHRVLACARCPFFEGLFQGRAGGRWLDGRDETEEVNVDLKHISSKTFALVLRHMYADTGSEIFQDITAANLDDYLDIIMDVLGAANELMLDRLSQICQAEIGRSVNARNICWLLNAISPSSVHEFKHAGLEYLCLNLESMLQGHHLNELDEDLLQELDEVVRQNQLACMPFAKSGRAERDLHERHPKLEEAMQRNRQIKIDGVLLRSKHYDLDSTLAGSHDDQSFVSQTRSKRRQSSNARAMPDVATLKVKTSSKDMMFSMDEDVGHDSVSPGPSPAIRPMASPSLGATAAGPPPDDQWYNSHGKAITSPVLRPQPSTTPGTATPRTPKSPLFSGKQPQFAAVPWSATTLAGAKHADLRDIMAQASSSRTSSLSQSIAAAKAPGPVLTPLNLPPVRLSQKDRKKIQQQQLAVVMSPTVAIPDTRSAAAAQSSPWHVVSGQRVPSLKDMLDTPKLTPPALKTPPNGRASSTPQLTMRQTVANPKPLTPNQKSIIGPAGTHMPHSASLTASKPIISPPQVALSSSAFPSLQNSKPTPSSVRHGPSTAEPSLQLSMQDILALQQMEKDVIKEAAAKRDLQEIQAEQEFQEWWDKESRRVQEAEAGDSAPDRSSTGKGARGTGGGPWSGRSNRGYRGRGSSRGRGVRVERKAGSSGLGEV